MSFIFVFTYSTMALLVAVLLIMLALSNEKEKENIAVKDVLLPRDQLEQHALELARNHVVTRGTGIPKWLVDRVNRNYKFILEVYRELNNEVAVKAEYPPAAEWLLDNFYIVEEQVKDTVSLLAKKQNARLPIIKNGYLAGYPRVYAIALELVSHTDSNVDEDTIKQFLKAYQSHTPLSMSELWYLNTMIKIALVENMRYICDKIIETQRQYRRADKLSEDIANNSEKGEIELQYLLEKYEMENTLIDPSFLEHFLKQLRNQGTRANAVIDFIENRLAEQKSCIEELANQEHQTQASRQVLIGNTITSLRSITSMNWVDIFEKLSLVEEILSSDPSGHYSKMDLNSRALYREMVQRIAHDHKTSEIMIAQMAIECSKEAEAAGNEAREGHVGFYLVGRGKKKLCKKIGRRMRISSGICTTAKNQPLLVYMGSISLLTIIFMAGLIAYAGSVNGLKSWWILILLGLVSIAPAGEICKTFVNYITSKVLRPTILPKMDMEQGFDNNTTMITIPTLLSSKKRAGELAEQLELHYLSNKEKGLYFSIVGDFKDSENENNPEDTGIVDVVSKKIDELNEKYKTDDYPIFYYFIRKRVFNKNDQRWMGWERKRGALMEFNTLLRQGENTSFKYSNVEKDKLPHIEYVITLDADTQLPIGSAKKLVGVMAHPLNKPLICDRKNVVIDGYGLIQPRISINVVSGNSSNFSRIFGGMGGLDPYTTAVSDIYQDLFGEGIFTGKGIYHVDTFEKVLSKAIPENSILSHDLLEGCYVRAGLATDIELVDGFPEKYSSYVMRSHRWVRGDWQLLPWLFNRIRNAQGKKIKNPLNLLSRYKIFDNLRRSLVSPSLILMLIFSFCIFPGNPLVYILIALMSVYFTCVIYIINTILNLGVLGVFPKKTALWSKNSVRNKSSAAITGFKSVFYQCSVLFSFLPYHAMLMADAVIRTLNRLLVRKRMLEWITAADMELLLKDSQLAYWKRMWICPVGGVIILLLSMYFRPTVSLFALLIFIFWFAAPTLAFNISIPKKKRQYKLTKEEQLLLRSISLKTWRYFNDTASPKDNFLPPDNLQENPPNGLAHRTSPTNIGLLFAAYETARDLGYLTSFQMTEKVNKTLTVVEKLDKWEGHLYNWYDTITLNTLRPRYISTVDSGNMISYMMTLTVAIQHYLETDLIDMKQLEGLQDMVILFNKNNSEKNFRINTEKLERVLDKGVMEYYTYYDILNDIKVQIESFPKREILKCWYGSYLYDAINERLKEFENTYFTRDRNRQLLESVVGGQDVQYITGELITSPVSLYNLYSTALKNIDKALIENANDYNDSLKMLKELKNELIKKKEYVGKHVDISRDICNRLQSIIDNTRFEPLYDSDKKLFSIGFNIEENKLTKSYYDLMASEARTASYIAVARGDVDIQHWFKLGRKLTMVDGSLGLVSWTGTMFEYFMPLLLLKSYDNTLLDDTYDFVVKVQKKYAKKHGIPWGISESGFYAFDLALNYQYKAFGVPYLGLKRGLGNDIVIAPYATIMALTTDPEGSINNIKRLIKEGCEGKYGFYEAIDFTPTRIMKDKKGRIVRSFMVHHQGMSLLALNNYLNNNIMQQRFHSIPVIKSAELLLQEKVPAKTILSKEYKEKFYLPKKRISFDKIEAVRKFGLPDSELPHLQLLSNGAYSVMITNGGSGYSKFNDMAVVRWNPDLYGVGSGFFVFVQNINNNTNWSATYEPLNVEPEEYKVVFSPEMAKFRRKDGDVITQTEIYVSAEENCEIRKVSFTNNGKENIILDVTSYNEIVLTHPDSDSAHPAFSNLFVTTEFISDPECLLAMRRPRGENQQPVWGVHSVFVDGNKVGSLQYESDRWKFLGRNRNLSNPLAIEVDQPLTNSAGFVLDPIMSLRRRVSIESGKTAVFYFVLGVADSKKTALEIAEKYTQVKDFERSFDMSKTRTMIESGYLGFNSEEIKLYLSMLPYIIYPSSLRKKWEKRILENSRSQPALWAYGISGDLPLIIFNISSKDEMTLLTRILKAHEYWRMKGLNVDIAVLLEKENDYVQPLYNAVKETVLSTHARDLLNLRGGIFILNQQQLPKEDIDLLYSVARVVIRGDGGAIDEQLNTGASPAVIKRPDNIRNLLNGAYSNINAVNTGTLEYYNGIGGFDNDGKEYVINLVSSQNTPLPWANIISNNRFGFIVTEAGGGYIWSENSRENKITPWYNDPVSDTPGEVIYVRDVSNGGFWSLTPSPVRYEGNYIVRHGKGYSTFTHTAEGCEFQLQEFVPVEDSCKINLVKIRNCSENVKELEMYYYMRPVLGVSDKISAQYIVSASENIAGNNAIILKNTYNIDFPERVAFVSCSKPGSFTCDRNEFIGINNTLEAPAAIRDGKLSGKCGAGYDPCAAIKNTITIEPGKETFLIYTVGQTENREGALQLAEKYMDERLCCDELEKVKNLWNERLGSIQVKTPDRSFDLLVNNWLLYQVIACRLFSRSAFYQSGGAYGYRDQLQDVMAVVPTWPEYTKKQILLHCAHQFEEGDVLHWWHEPAGKGIRTRYSDDLLWLAYVTADYVNITGDNDILNERVGFVKDRPLPEGVDERYNVPAKSDKIATVYEHCKLAIGRALKYGPHGIPLMGSGDWNDGMNTVGNKGTGESIWLGWFLYTILERFIPIAEKMGDAETAEHYKQHLSKISESIEENAWDGSWYIRAYFDDGTPLGSAQNSECRIDSLAQSWAVISGAGRKDRIEEAMSAVEKYLVDREEGIIKLLTPPFNDGELEPGYIKGYLPGARENGGQYTHAATWVIMAFAKMGQGNKAWELFNMINPINHSRTWMEAARYKAEPYVMAADVMAVHPNIGRSGWTWYTGAAGWMYRIALEHILGFKKAGQELEINPCIPREWKDYSIKYKYGSSEYNLWIKNPEGVNSGVKSVIIDGKAHTELKIGLVDDGKKHEVEIMMGN